MAELFTKTEVDFGGAMTAQFGVVVPDGAFTGVLMQNIQLSYQQQVTRLYELGTRGAKTNVYYVSGRAQGTMSVAHVVGPGVTIAAFYVKFSDVCKAGTNQLKIDLSPNLCDGSTPVVYTCKYCVLVSIGMSVAAQDFVINTNSQMMFSGLSYDGI